MVGFRDLVGTGMALHQFQEKLLLRFLYILCCSGPRCTMTLFLLDDLLRKFCQYSECQAILVRNFANLKCINANQSVCKFNGTQNRVSNGTGQRNFLGQQDSQNFFVPGQRDNRTEVPSLSRDKGTTGQAQNLAKGRDVPGQPKPGTGRAGTAKIRDGTRDKTGQSRKGCSKTV